MSSGINELPPELEGRLQEGLCRVHDIEAQRVIRRLVFDLHSEIKDLEFQLQPASPSSEIRAAIAAVLSRPGTMLHYREIYRRIVAEGIVLKGKDPARTMTWHLSEDARFESDYEGNWFWRQKTPMRPQTRVNPYG